MQSRFCVRKILVIRSRDFSFRRLLAAWFASAYRPSYPFYGPVIPGQSSVRKGEAGSPAELYKLQRGLAVQA